LLDRFQKYDFKIHHDQPIRPKIYLVGGAIRDFLLDREVKDFDFVVEGLTKKSLHEFLLTIPGKLMDIEGRNFGVFKLQLENCDLEFLDIAMPRIDIYEDYGKGHKDVQVDTSSSLTIDDDLSRRDFTINAMAVNIFEQKIIDPFDGLGDLQHKLIKAVGNPHERLVNEDPTRMLRALRLAAKYDLQIESKTFEVICNHHQEINHKFIQNYKNKKGIIKPREIERVSRDIIAAEFIKGFYHNPYQMIRLLDETKVYREIFPSKFVEIWDKLKTTDQPKNFHYEGSVWNHTMLALQNIDKIASNNIGIPVFYSINLKLAVWLHDFGKVETIKIDQEGNFTYYNHPQVSAKLASFLFSKMKVNSMFGVNSIYCVNEKDVIFIIENHMLPFGPDVEGMKDSTIAKYYLQEIIPPNYDFKNSQTEIVQSQAGIEVLQMAYVDANSAIKERGQQDFTGLKRMIAKIADVKSRLEIFAKNRKIYPVNGNEIMDVLKEIAKDSKNPILTHTSQNGGKLIGELLDYILDDALNKPEVYNNNPDLTKHVTVIIKQYLIDNNYF
jgi:tRNA nucleotidyltransferase/poly(A) polymerase